MLFPISAIALKKMARQAMAVSASASKLSITGVELWFLTLFIETKSGLYRRLPGSDDDVMV
jgi:hypothetical protein